MGDPSGADGDRLKKRPAEREGSGKERPATSGAAAVKETAPAGGNPGDAGNLLPNPF
jgi:hypothetical protein